MRRIWILGMLLLLLLTGCSGAPSVEVDDLSEVRLSDREAVALQEKALEAADCYRDLLTAPTDTVNRTLTDGQMGEILDRLALLGPAIDTENAFDLRQPEPVRAFGQSLRGDLLLYRLHRDGGLSVLHFAGEPATLTTVRVDWDGDLAPRVVGITHRDLTQLRYTDKGYLVWQTRERASVTTGPGYAPYQFLRVESLDQTCRELCRTYIRPVGYYHDLFRTDWGPEAGPANWHDVFRVCYFLDTGVLLTGHDSGDYLSVPGVGVLVPEADFVRYITRYFPVDPETVLARSRVDPDSGCYPVDIFTSSDLGRSLPVPEVVAWTQNQDGSLTMTVETLDADTGDDRSLVHRVTVLPREDGWYYVENRVLAENHGNATAG